MTINGKDNRDLTHYKEYYVYSLAFVALAAGNGLTYVDNDLRIDSDAPFQFLKTTYFSTNDLPDIFVKYKDDTNGRYLLKSAVPLRNIAGMALPLDGSSSWDFRPFIWPYPYTIRKSTSLTTSMANGHAVITPTIYLTFHGAKIRQGRAPWLKDGVVLQPYVYPLVRGAVNLPESVVQVGANQTSTFSINTDNDSSFVVNKIVGSSLGGALVTMQEMGTDRQWMNQTTHIRNLIGSGAAPNILAAPRLINRASTLSITIQDISGLPNLISINLIGSKIFG